MKPRRNRKKTRPRSANTENYFYNQRWRHGFCSSHLFRFIGHAKGLWSRIIFRVREGVVLIVVSHVQRGRVVNLVRGAFGSLIPSLVIHPITQQGLVRHPYIFLFFFFSILRFTYNLPHVNKTRNRLIWYTYVRINLTWNNRMLHKMMEIVAWKLWIRIRHACIRVTEPHMKSNLI